LKTVLTVAGSDCGGGAGIQADIKTIAAHKIYATSVITALTAQNTTGVYGIEEVSPEFVGRQLDCVFADIFPDAVKIGMLSNAAIIGFVADKLAQYRAKNVVLDPVMISTSGTKLLSDGAVGVAISRLFPLVGILTPNIPEAEALSGTAIEDTGGMLAAAKKISALLCGGAVLIKGGHLLGDATDLLYWNGEAVWFEGERILNPNTHGTGCTLSSAIACNLACGRDCAVSVRNAKTYITGAIRTGLNLGKGGGPLAHCT
jgi:hydroxymethylpyrimidine/phosphomethylpyrimidine kinase